MKEIDLAKLYELAGADLLPLEEKLHAFSLLLRRNFELRIFFEDETVPQEGKKKLLTSLFPEDQSIFRQLLDFLVEQGLEKRLIGLASALTDLVASRQGIVFVDVESAYPLETELLPEISKLVGGKVRFRQRLRSDLIGGFKFLTSDKRFFDGTLKHSLNDLRKELLCPTILTCQP